jgi:hypothetical protein
VIAAAVEVETIVGTGPAFSLLGLIVCVGWVFSRSIATLVFGLSASAISLFLLALIAGLHWSPSDASIPVPLILLGYEIVAVPIGLASLYRILARRAKKRRDRFWQYNLWLLLAVTTLAAATAAVVRLALQFGTPVLVTAAIGAAVATVASIGLVILRGLTDRSGTAEDVKLGDDVLTQNDHPF